MSHVKAKMHQSRFRLGLCPYPAGGAHSTSPTPYMDLKRPTSKVREGGMTEGKGKGGERGTEQRVEEGKGRGRGLGSVPPVPNLLLHHCLLRGSSSATTQIGLFKSAVLLPHS